MKKLFRGFVLLVAVLIMQLTFLPPNEAYASENPLTISNLNVQVMPEFINPDEWDYTVPSLLVGYHVSIVNETEEPYDGEIIFKLPINLPQFQLGYVAQEVGEQHIPVDINVNDEGQYIALTPQEPIAPNETIDLIIEHFSASIEGGGERAFSFEYSSDVNIADFNVAIYAPFRAENFQVDLEPSLIADSFGGEVYIYEMEEFNQGEAIVFEVSYSKDSNVTTLEAFNDMQGMPDDDIHAGLNEGGQAQGGNNSFISTEDAVLISLTVIIVGAFIFVIIRKKKNGEVASKEAGAKPKKIVNKEEEIKKLRKMLAEGKIDEKTYKEKRSKLG